MIYYIIFWIFFIFVRAIHNAYRGYKIDLDAGYHQIHFEQTGQLIQYNGSFGERIGCTIAGSLGLLFSPFFLFRETLFSIPAIGVLYFLNQ
tara:strand:+ start:99 stop:371 length:273 start_codon:yes stop_codon:yes gene_type:complete